MMFIDAAASHAHSLETLNALAEYDDFMDSIETLIDLGCGEGLDLEWWAARTTRDESPQPLNINCTGLDTLSELPIARQYSNITYQQTDFEGQIHTPKKKRYDVLWCHDAFQYALNPLQTLANWYNIASDGAMLVICVPQTTNFRQQQMAFVQPTATYYHYTMVNLIHMLAVTGWDCNAGFFKKNPMDNWIWAVVYKSDQTPMNPRTTSWYDLVEKNLLPESANKSVMSHGYLRQQDLVIPWLDQNLSWMGHQ